MLSLPKIFITEKGERHARSGHPWVFEGEVVRTEDNPSDGGLVTVFTEPRNGGKAKFSGSGYYNSHSKIRVRLISTNAN
ncbi:MAG: rRNA large subunit methyltransferase I, partial [Clostridia bacterium]|nr:rRNA large subunit methyltransferase I [Clostridia bacterium]